MKKTLCTISIFALLSPSPCFADEGNLEKDSFTGQVSGGVMLIDSGNNLNPNSSKEIISDLDSPADRELNTVPLLYLNLSYAPDPENSFRYILTTRPPIEEAGAFAFGLGAGIDIFGFANAEAAVFAAPFGEVWENPYLVGEKRQETDNEKYGAYLKLDRLLSTRFQVTAYYFTDNVDNDLIAILEPDLARDGQTFGTKIGYMIPLGAPSFMLMPSAGVSAGDYDGKANTYLHYNFKLGARYTINKFTFMPELVYTLTEYDEIDPVFDRTRDEDKISANLMMQYAAPFGLENYSIQTLIAYSQSDANIEFYDTESIAVGLSLNYRF